MMNFLGKAISACLLIALVVVIMQGVVGTKVQTQTFIFQHDDPQRITLFIAEFSNHPLIQVVAEPEVSKEAGLVFVTIRYKTKKP